MGWTPWVLMALGLACFIPVAVETSAIRSGGFARRGTGAWSGWGVTLYLLGFLLATQVGRSPTSGSTRKRPPSVSHPLDDVGLWYVFGIHHITRPEECP